MWHQGQAASLPWEETLRGQLGTWLLVQRMTLLHQSLHPAALQARSRKAYSVKGASPTCIKAVQGLGRIQAFGAGRSGPALHARGAEELEQHETRAQLVSFFPSVVASHSPGQEAAYAWCLMRRALHMVKQQTRAGMLTKEVQAPYGSSHVRPQGLNSPPAKTCQDGMQPQPQPPGGPVGS